MQLANRRSSVLKRRIKPPHDGDWNNLWPVPTSNNSRAPPQPHVTNRSPAWLKERTAPEQLVVSVRYVSRVVRSTSRIGKPSGVKANVLPSGRQATWLVPR